MASIQPHGLPSPVTSVNSPAPSNADSIAGASSLPTQRQHPLKPGSHKEIALINYVDDKVLYITRRYGTKFTDIKTKKNEAPGYTTFDEVVADIDPLIDLVWITGTATLQISYLLTFAGFVASFMPSFPFSTSMFRVLKRLDAAFSTLLQGTQTTPARMSMTEKVRIRSIIEETRVNAVNTATASGHSTQIEELFDDEELGDDAEEDQDELEDQPAAFAISKIYKTTMEILGDSLTG